MVTVDVGDRPNRHKNQDYFERKRAFPDTYAPFTIDEYRAMPLDYSFLDQCVGWPVAPPGQPALLFALYGRTAARGKLVAQGSCRTWHIL